MRTYDWKIIAETANDEAEMVDFKSIFEPDRPGFWCEIVKDIVSFANTSGGVIVFGLDSDGNPSSSDCTLAEKTDVADISNQITKYTLASIGSLRKFWVERSGKKFWCISCDPENTLIPFTKPGTYEPIKGQQKNAFSIGTIYVRHGSKSEACTREDLRKWIERELEIIRNDWLLNIRKVVEAPLGQTVVVSNISSSDFGSGATVSARITIDPNAIPVRLQNPQQDWPHRGADVLKNFNERNFLHKLNSHDLVALKHACGIDEQKRPDFMLKTHNQASPQYSSQFIDWLVSEYNKDNNLFINARKEWHTHYYG